MTTTICLTFDFDAVSLWISTFKLTTPTPLSRGEYGARVGIHRILELLATKGVPATFFVPGHTAVNFPDEVKKVAQAGHEIALHGYCHEAPSSLAPDDEPRLLQGSLDKLRQALGASFTPVGYRSPSWDLSPNSIACLEAFGLLYDSSLMADDFSPYWARRGTKADSESYTPGTPTKLVEMPVAWELDDFSYFHHSSRVNEGLRSPDEVFEIWRGEFDYCHEEVSNGVFTLTCHPQVIGRGPRMRMLGRLIDHMKAGSGVRFATMAEAARHHATLLSS